MAWYVKIRCKYTEIRGVSEKMSSRPVEKWRFMAFCFNACLTVFVPVECDRTTNFYEVFINIALFFSVLPPQLAD